MLVLPRVKRCSTPEGIGAAITAGGGLASHLAVLCSTPEGIGAAITRLTVRMAHHMHVLNARRHRRGDHTRTVTSPL